ncbi:hypothetical protein NDU88_006738 [Pleurodeles waltl]|uniref:Uncharacterized protein n=1 Tax=Pleurodeles waltl TaxID=8319 RepID=A0AAV7TYM1_PLEWA|nr:hypothetical protein NDU88_006738 [Pleurodeles waltl]
MQAPVKASSHEQPAPHDPAAISNAACCMAVISNASLCLIPSLPRAHSRECREPPGTSISLRLHPCRQVHKRHDRRPTQQDMTTTCETSSLFRLCC